MKKKFLTKRGFTIVEVLVAFVIFAIMAGMVATILSSTMRAKQDNTALEAEIARQQNEYYTKTQDRTYDSSSSGQLTFNFSGIAPVEINYSVGDPNASDADNQIALDYFVGDVDYSVMDGKSAQPEKKGDNGGGSVADRFASTGIYGSNGITSINVILQKDDSYTAGNRYFIAAKAVGDTDEQYDMFKQYRLTFPSEVLKYGYCHYQQSGSLFRDVDTTSHSGYNVTQTSSDTIRIAATQTTSSTPLINSGYKAMYVVLDSPLDTLNLYDVFGCCETGQTIKSTQSDGSYLFTRYLEKTTDEDGNEVETTHTNVFAAVEKEKTTS